MDREKILDRKKRLGRHASYRRIGERVRVSHHNVRMVLTGQETPIKMDRERILRDVARVLDEIESDLKSCPVPATGDVG